MIAQGAWQAWTFGPALLDGSGNVPESFHSTEYLNKVNPRAAIGYVAPGHYKFVVVDGRQDGYSAGVTMSQLAQLMKEEGCLTAYNLDGGKSAVMYYNGTAVSKPISGGEVRRGHMKILKALLPHITIVLCILFLVLWILDYFNPMMHFLTAALPKALLLVFIASAAATAIMAVAYQRK